MSVPTTLRLCLPARRPRRAASWVSVKRSGTREKPRLRGFRGGEVDSVSRSMPLERVIGGNPSS